jgi:hypothetical protein
MSARARIVAVVGAGSCDAPTAEAAREVGRRIAERGAWLATGGLGGVMEAASRGAAEAGGRVVGILPGGDPEDANPWVELALATGLGEARNLVLVGAAEVVIAIAGGHGTLSEIAFALKLGKRVVGLATWDVDLRIVRAASAAEAVQLALG